MVDFEWYRTFLSVYETRTTTAAAETRSMTQPGVSQHLAALEHALACRLFERTSRGMVPTDAGTGLYQRLQGSLRDLEGVEPRWREVGARHGIAGPRWPAGLPVFLVAIGCGKRPGRPHRIRAELRSHDEMHEGLLSEELDVALMGRRPQDSRLLVHQFASETFVLAAPSGWPLPQAETLPEALNCLKDQSWIAYDPQLSVIRRFWQQVLSRAPHDDTGGGRARPDTHPRPWSSEASGCRFCRPTSPPTRKPGGSCAASSSRFCHR